MADPVIDEFAQTRGADDLFDDEIVPVPAEEQTPPDVPAQTQENPVTVLEKEPPRAPSAHVDTPPRSRGGERRGRGRGKGGRGRQGSQHSGSRRGGDAGSRPDSSDNKNDNAEPEGEGGAEDSTRDESTEQQGQEEHATTDTKTDETQRVPAVRGDRSATGGLRKPKLTEEELSKKIAAAKENAAKVAAAHARAEADQASFLEREKVAEAKRRQERANRRVMDNERERNRQRKLDAVTGREWDSTKREDDYSSRGGGRGQFRRGMHGGVSGYHRRDVEPEGEGEGGDDLSQSIHSPRRARGGRGSGGRGRGSFPPRGPRGETHDNAPAPSEPRVEKPAPPSVPSLDNKSEFPALPGGGDKKEKPNPTLSPEAAASEDPKPQPSIWAESPIGGSWADQVEGA